VYQKHLQTVRPQRVYLKKGVKPIDFLKALTQRNVEYVLLRWWENLPEYPKGEDLNILVKDEHRDQMDDLLTPFDSRGTKCDVYTVTGAKNGSRINVPVFPYNLTQALLNTRYLFQGAYVPAPVPYFASIAYHAVLHKGHNSGVPGFGVAPTKYVYDYSTVLKEMAAHLGISVEITVTGLYNWLKKEGFAPAADTLTKLVENRPELSILETSLFSDIRGGELIVYVVRERLLQDELLYDFINFLKDNYHFDVLDVLVLNNAQKNTCTSQIRGGKWDNGPFEYSGGPPVALVSVYDYHPGPLSEAEQKKQTRVTNKNTIDAKYRFRELVNSMASTKGVYNGIHSADNEHDALYYLSLIGEDYLEKITTEVECRRSRYARKWAIEKTVSAGSRSKVEIIRYEQGLAVKKTFRPEKELFFGRELFAHKELSKELDFIPPLLEEGDGYMILPYLKNKLDGMQDKEKKQLLASKRDEIVRVFWEMYTRGLSYSDFTPANVIITPEDDFYCLGFESLQNRDGVRPELDEANTSFNRIWGPYLGSWESINYIYQQA
jgi:hypothetical protein